MQTGGTVATGPGAPIAGTHILTPSGEMIARGEYVVGPPGQEVAMSAEKYAEMQREREAQVAPVRPTPAQYMVPSDRPSYFVTPEGRIDVQRVELTRRATVEDVVQTAAAASRMAREQTMKTYPAIGAVFRSQTEGGFLYEFEPLQATRQRRAEEVVSREMRMETPFETRRAHILTAIGSPYGGEYLASYLPGGREPSDVVYKTRVRAQFIETPRKKAEWVVGAVFGTVPGIIGISTGIGYVGGRALGYLEKSPFVLAKGVKGTATLGGMAMAGPYAFERAYTTTKAIKEEDYEKALEIVSRTGLELHFGARGFKEGYKASRGIELGEQIYQPKTREFESFSVGDVDEALGTVTHRGVTQAERVFGAYQQEFLARGRAGSVGKLDTGFTQFRSRKGDLMFGVSYDISIPEMSGLQRLGDVSRTMYGQELTGRITTGMPTPTGRSKVLSVWDMFKQTSYVQQPRGVWYGGYGVVPETRIGFEKVSGFTLAQTQITGEPTVVKEWKIPGATWRDADIEMMKMRTTTRAGGISVTPEGFQPFRGTGVIDVTGRVMVSGGGGRQIFVPSVAPSFGDMAATVTFKTPSWVGDTRVFSGIGTIITGRAAVAAQYKPAEKVGIWEGAVHPIFQVMKEKKKKKKDVDIVVSKDINMDMKKALQLASGTARATAIRQKMKLDVLQDIGRAQDIGMASIQSQQQQQQQQQMMSQMMRTTTPIISIVPTITTPPGLPASFKKDIWVYTRRRKKAKRKKIKYKRTYRYTPTVVGAVFRKPLKRAPKRVTIQSVGIRAPVAGRAMMQGIGRFGEQPKKRKKKGVWESSISEVGNRMGKVLGVGGGGMPKSFGGLKPRKKRKKKRKARRKKR